MKKQTVHKKGEKMVKKNDETKEMNETVNQAGKIVWNDREMNSSYSNVCNVAANADEFMLLFGESEAWNSAQKDIVVKLRQRIIMTPTTAKRFATLLNKTIEEREKKDK